MLNWLFQNLRVVQTKAISFLKSMSESVGSDIERLWNWISRLTQNRLKIMSFKFRVVLCRIRLFPTLISKIKWYGSELPWILSLSRSKSPAKITRWNLELWLLDYDRATCPWIHFIRRFWVVGFRCTKRDKFKRIINIAKLYNLHLILFLLFSWCIFGVTYDISSLNFKIV